MAADEGDQHGSAEPELEQDLVWHYTDATGLLSILRSSTLWATSSRFLNDAHEVRLGWELLRQEIQRRALTDPFYTSLLGEEAAGFTDGGPSPAEFFVLSAAQHWDVLAMWRNYGGRGESYAIGLERAAPLAALIDDTGAGIPAAPGHLPQVRQRPWSPIRYNHSDKARLVAGVFSNLEEELAWLKARTAEAMPADEVLAGVMGLLDEIEQTMLLSKHEGFVDEREIRHSTVVFRGLPPGSTFSDIHAADDVTDAQLPPGLIQFRATPYGLAPYVRLTGSVDGAAMSVAPQRLPIRALATPARPSGTRAWPS